MLKVGVINYINTLPFFAALQKGYLKSKAAFFPGLPSELNSRLREGGIDISLISSSEYLQYPNEYKVIPNFCIAARERVLSVCLFTRKPLADLDQQIIAVTPESASAVQLLKVLCHHYWHIVPQIERLSGRLHDISQTKKYEAFLLIGDLCLRHPEFAGYQTIDLAQAWYYATGLPFTFAVLAAKRFLFSEREREIEELKYSLQESLEWARNHKEKIIQIALTQCPISEDRLRKYFEMLHYTMTTQHLRGLEKFKLLSQSLANFRETYDTP